MGLVILPTRILEGEPRHGCGAHPESIAELACVLPDEAHPVRPDPGYMPRQLPDSPLMGRDPKANLIISQTAQGLDQQHVVVLPSLVERGKFGCPVDH